jgi:hypothetical protein
MARAAPATPPPPPLVTFHRLIEHGRPPERADRSALGTLPTGAYRHCEAAAAASGFGWYLSRRPPVAALIPAAGSPDPCGPGTAGLGRGRSGACGVNQGRSGFPEAGIRPGSP